MSSSAGTRLWQSRGENLDPGLSFAERLAEEYQVIYGCGNHEYRLKLYPEQYGDLYEKLRERLKKAGICYLENETADLTISGCPVRIYGYAWTAPITTAFTADRCRFRN